jgi:hypothetical protein
MCTKIAMVLVVCVRSVSVRFVLPTLWYIEPGDEFTNKVLADALPEVQFSQGVRCSDGKYRNLWMVTYSNVLYFWRNKKSLGGLCLDIWYRRKQDKKVVWYAGNSSYVHFEPGRKLLRRLNSYRKHRSKSAKVRRKCAQSKR